MNLPEDTKMEILSKLDDLALYHLCNTDKSFHKICQSRFKDKLEKIYRIINYPIDPKVLYDGDRIYMEDFLDEFIDDNDENDYKTIIYRSVNGFTLYLNEYGDNTIGKIEFKGPIEINKGELFKIISQYMTEDMIDQYYKNDAFILEFIEKHNHDYYLVLGS